MRTVQSFRSSTESLDHPGAQSTPRTPKHAGSSTQSSIVILEDLGRVQFRSEAGATDLQGLGRQTASPVELPEGTQKNALEEILRQKINVFVVGDSSTAKKLRANEWKKNLRISDLQELRRKGEIIIGVNPRNPSTAASLNIAESDSKVVKKYSTLTWILSNELIQEKHWKNHTPDLNRAISYNTVVAEKFKHIQDRMQQASVTYAEQYGNARELEVFIKECPSPDPKQKKTKKPEEWSLFSPGQGPSASKPYNGAQ